MKDQEIREKDFQGLPYPEDFSIDMSNIKGLNVEMPGEDKLVVVYMRSNQNLNILLFIMETPSSTSMWGVKGFI